MAIPSKHARPFVGRREELAAFDRVLRDPAGQAIVVVGQAGMGKTMLVDRMAACAADHPDLRCGSVRYEVTPTDDVAGTMALMMDHAFEAARVGHKVLAGNERQWQALFKTVKLIPLVGPTAEVIGDLALSLIRDPAKDTRTQFAQRLRLISEKMPPEGRAIFVIDPERRLGRGLYHRRWEIETTFFELKVSQGMKTSLRSRTPEGIRYEVAGHVLFYFLIRWMMVEVATAHKEDPLRLSFSQALRELQDISQTLITASPRRVSRVLLPRLMARIAQHLVPQRPGRHYSRPYDTKVKYKGRGHRRLPSKLSTKLPRRLRKRRRAA